MTALDSMTREELAAEVTRLRGELALMREERFYTLLRKNLRMTPVETRFLMALYEANGEPLTAWDIDQKAPAPSGLDRASNVVAVFVSRLRGRLGRTSVDTVWNKGWALTPVGIAKVNKALEGAGVAT